LLLVAVCQFEECQVFFGIALRVGGFGCFCVEFFGFRKVLGSSPTMLIALSEIVLSFEVALGC
jgi:hypothetical protein